MPAVLGPSYTVNIWVEYMNELITRRQALKYAGMMAGAGIVLPAILSACEKGCSPTNVVPPHQGPPAADLPMKCPDMPELSENDLTARRVLNYVDKTANDATTCDNCKLYTRPVPGAVCGGCQILQGPIHPKGYCTAWIRQM